jgi:hypothetical protein
MELDPKINSVHDILTPFDTKEATDFIGEYCAFADGIEDFKDVGDSCNVFYGELKRVKENENSPFEYELTVSHLITTAKFCLPYARFKKKWQPFSLTEWRHNYSIGDEIVFRMKGSDTCKVYMYCGLISDHDDDSPGEGVINLGGELFVLQNLFDQFELRRNDDWQPFGVEE